MSSLIYLIGTIVLVAFGVIAYITAILLVLVLLCGIFYPRVLYRSFTNLHPGLRACALILALSFPFRWLVIYHVIPDVASFLTPIDDAIIQFVGVGFPACLILGLVSITGVLKKIQISMRAASVIRGVMRTCVLTFLLLVCIFTMIAIVEQPVHEDDGDYMEEPWM